MAAVSFSIVVGNHGQAGRSFGAGLPDGPAHESDPAFRLPAATGFLLPFMATGHGKQVASTVGPSWQSERRSSADSMSRLAIGICVVAGLFGPAMMPQPAAALRACVHSWAVPGPYTVTGDFRGRTESATVRLTTSCRLYFQVPGVFSGGRVQAAGECLSFSFKVEGRPETFRGTWCDAHALVRWNDRVTRVSVRRERRR